MRRIRRSSIGASGFGLAWLLSFALASCADEGIATGLMLIVDADEAVRGMAATLEVRVRGEKGGDVNELAPLVYGDESSIGWPRRIAIAPKADDADRTLRVHVLAFADGASTAFVEARVITGYVRGQRQTLRITLASPCIGLVCGDDETCYQGECVDARSAWQPDGPDAGVGEGCDSGPTNACGGCAELEAEPGSGCGPCGLGEYVCDGPEALFCSGVTSCWTEVSAGETHTCARRMDGTLYCWGAGASGQRGDGSESTSLATPTRVLPPAEVGGSPWADWAEVSAGGSHTCGRRSNGTLWCWGAGASGQRGDGTTTAIRSTPMQVVAAGEPPGGATWSDWTAVHAFATHTCGRRSNGTLWCWGDGGNGRRGDGTTTATRSTPIQVLAAGAAAGGATWSDWLGVSPGSRANLACALRAGGTLWCWGTGSLGQRGDGTTSATRSTPIQVLAENQTAGGSTWTDWTAVAAGDSHSCGRRTNGTAWCWGAQAYGRLGDGDSDLDANGVPVWSVVLAPTKVLQSGEAPGGLAWSDWTALAVGTGHACGLRTGGTLWCWGAGNLGQRGDGTTDLARATPIQVVATGVGAPWSDWTAVTAGSVHTCGIRSNGTLWCWGTGTQGRRGDGTTTMTQSVPSKVIEP
jgi:alpha-tubulin suppressor-like RCC1 family protein